MSRVRVPGQARRGHIAMFAFSALVAGSFSLGGMVANEIEPTALNAARFVLAAAVIGAVVLARRQMQRAAFVAPWRYLILGGLFAIYFVTMFEGLKTAPAVSASAVFTLTPLLAAGFGWFLQRQVLTPRMALALAIGAFGALWVIFRADFAAIRAFEIGRGESIFFWGCVAHAAYAPMVPRLNRGERPVVFTFGTLVAAAIVIIIYGAGDILATDWTALSPLVWITLFYIAIPASSVTFVLVQFAALRLPASKVMAYTYLVPSWVICWESAFGEPVPPAMVMIGIAMTMLALLLLLKTE
ncbi:DMT family transporter [Aliiruegeria lutimaris]|uniref:EamA-like transporter family protein n=1 Tax=Aliiruegeria lutimaris TaxID=571298 RepID=A0A1G8SHL1_9RHOB|nr:DMT family transporter [Aliiruegeria lutimaris]SDJ28634.1 EamA-like transporter family protein [Aliiruegeria lutimaris]